MIYLLEDLDILGFGRTKLAVFIDPFMTVSAGWTIADIFNAMMAIPNLIAIIALSGVITAETKKYFKKKSI